MKDCLHRALNIVALKQKVTQVQLEGNSQPTSPQGFCEILTLYTAYCIPQICAQSNCDENNCPAIEFSRH